MAGRRLITLQDRQREISAAWHRSMEGSVVNVLVEGPSRHDEGVVCGRTSSNVMVNFPGTMSLLGQHLDVRVTRGFTHSCRGERVV